MVSVELQNIGKKFGREWIFRNLNYTIASGQKLVILGGNGSGKSTLLQVICGFVGINEGQMVYTRTSGPTPQVVSEEDLRLFVSFSSPYLQLIEDFTMLEMIEHAAQFKPFQAGLTPEEVMKIAELNHAANKPIKQFSSGMKQRLKLALAILADTPLLLLDEPVSNLDKAAISWYKEMVVSYGKQRTVIVCSNAIEEEFVFCTSQLTVSDFKPKIL